MRNVALRIEARLARHRRLEPSEGFDPESLAADEPSLSQVFDRAWATSLLREAGRLQAEQAKPRGEEALRRVELLRLRFQEGLPIREIAQSFVIESFPSCVLVDKSGKIVQSESRGGMSRS